MNKKKKLTIKAELGNIGMATSFVIGELLDAGCEMIVAQRIELALEEMLVNVVSYAYPEEPGDFTLTTSFPVEDVISLEITDEGIPYDPTKKPDPNVDIPLKQRAKGGLGIFMAKKIMDEMKYDHDGEFNHTVMTKKFK